MHTCLLCVPEGCSRPGNLAVTYPHPCSLLQGEHSPSGCMSMRAFVSLQLPWPYLSSQPRPLTSAQTWITGPALLPSWSLLHITLPQLSGRVRCLLWVILWRAPLSCFMSALPASMVRLLPGVGKGTEQALTHPPPSTKPEGGHSRDRHFRARGMFPSSPRPDKKSQTSAQCWKAGVFGGQSLFTFEDWARHSLQM